jgi:YD repeat-containing protein
MLYAIPVLATEYFYNDANQITSVTFDNGKVLTYTYDSRGNLVNIVSNDLMAVLTDPVDQDVDVPVDKVITVTFVEDIQAASNIGQITINHGETAINYSYSINGDKLILTPAQSLSSDTTYQVAVPAGSVEGIFGNKLFSDLKFSFTTEAVDTIPVTGVSLNKTSTSLNVGATETLTATITPENATNKNVSWTSSNEAVATVSSDGTVTGVGVGTATITVTTTDCNFTASCEVSVNVENIPVTGVSLNKASTSINELEEDTLIATITPSDATNQDVTWSSSDTEVATVDSTGTIIGVAPGTATITVTTADGGFTANCVVTVTDTNIAVDGVSLNKTSDSIYIGSYDTLVASINPTNATNQNVTWSSSDNNIATVDSTGKVTGVSIGTATITVTTEDGNKTATCTITVSEQLTIPVTGVTLDQETMTLTAGGSTGVLTATITPANATNQNVTWISSDDTIATVANGVVTPVAAGTAIITVTTVDGSYTAICAVTVN